jgi:hypothetical protein
MKFAYYLHQKERIIFSKFTKENCDFKNEVYASPSLKKVRGRRFQIHQDEF